MPSCAVCFVCGVGIQGDEGDILWLREFRILYSVDSSSGSTVESDAESIAGFDEGVTHISGVGINFDNSWEAPLGENRIWGEDRQESVRVAVMREAGVAGRPGFVLHDSCWRLLRAALDPQPVPLERLYHLCESLPMPRGWKGLCWDHNYGGMLVLDVEQHHLPGGHYHREPAHPYNVQQPAWVDPYDVPEVSELLVLRRDETESRVSTTSWKSQDCFARVPEEICQAIAKVTPTSDALNLGLASRSFTDIVTSRVFWESRFAPGGEHDYVFEARKCKQNTDWKRLYDRTGGAWAPPPIQNRIRIWKLIRSMEELLELRPESAEGRAVRKRQFRDVEDPKWRWDQVSGDVSEERGAFYPTSFIEGCRCLGRARAAVPSSLSRIAVSVIQVGDADYVSGLRLISGEDGDQQLGFRAEGKERSFAVTADALHGLNVAVGPRGIRALQVVCRDGTQSPWFGRAVNTAITERLRCARRIVALEVGFDGYKLVRFAVAESPADPALPVPSLATAEPHLRAAASWFPALPPQGLCLNDASFMGVSEDRSAYRPMQWILFGGCKGEHLRHLTRVSVNRLGRVHKIRFHYDGDGLQDQELTFGLLPIIDNGALNNTQHFPIDGKGGERITALATGVSDNRHAFQDGFKFSFEIATNRGRSLHFCTITPPRQTILKPLNIAPGTTIVGLCTCQHPEVGIVGLGVISAEVEE